MTNRNATKQRITFAALGTALLLGGGFSLSQAHAAGKTPIKAKAKTMGMVPHGTITPWEAMKIANKGIGGKAIAANYGFEDGHWLYDVIIIKNQKLMEVEVDAKTGKTAAAETVTAEEEGKETTDDLNTALGKPAAAPAPAAAGTGETKD